jgi:hypothetical protein
MFLAWPKIPRLENEIFHLTEKIDGTNAAIIIKSKNSLEQGVFSHTPIELSNDYGIWAQSRTRLIYPTDDNYGFAKWVADNHETLIQDLGEGYHFGEWWGKGINRNYGLTERKFSLFNPTKQSSICDNVPELGLSNSYPEACISDAVNLLIEKGSVASPGFMNPEGVIVYAEKAKSYWKVIINK